jgi:membrane-associated PAP2 superfamily phosphatase
VLDTVFGLPTHPLIVHATVVVVPTAAVAVLLAAVWPRFRAWAGWGPPALAVLAVVLTPLSTSTGESLEHRVGTSHLVEEHAQLADMLLWWVIPLAVLAIATYALHRTGRQTVGGRALTVVLAVVPVLVALGTIVQVVLIGHSGARAAWSDVGTSASSHAGRSGGD